MRSVLPPRKKDWKPGDVQLGVFWRGPSGATLELTADTSTPEEQAAAAALIKLICERQAVK